MNTIIEVMNALPNVLALKQATEEQIADAENILGVKFADEYKKYLLVFGAIIADGIELTGIAKSEHRNVICVTRDERKLNPNVPHAMYVVENTYIDGVIIWQDDTGAVYRTQYDDKPKQIAESLAEYICNTTKTL